MSKAPEYHCGGCGVVHEYGKHVDPTPTQGDDELQTILNRLDTDFHDYHDGRWNYDDPKPIEKAKAALAAHIRRAEAYGRLHEVIEAFQAGQASADYYSKRHEVLSAEISKLNGGD